MSVSNLLVPNTLNLFCGSITQSSGPVPNYTQQIATTVTNSGPFTTPPSAFISLTKVGRSVTLGLSGVIAPASNSAVITFSINIPTNYLPIVNSDTPGDNVFIISVTNNSVKTSGILSITLAGVITISNGLVPGTAFTNSGNAGYGSTSVSYISNS